MRSSLEQTYRFRSLGLASLVALSACGEVAFEQPAVTDPTTTVEGELTRPLESGVARRSYGSATTVRAYTFRIGEGSAANTLIVDLTGTGQAKLTVTSPDGAQTCSRTAAVIDHHCTFDSASAGTWNLEVAGVTDFSGSLVATLTPVVATPDAGSDDVGHGPLSDGAQLSEHTAMGLPDTATMLTPSHFRVVKRQYVVSYNSTYKVPNWVSWQLSTSWLGSAVRSSSFTPDPNLPNTMPQSSNADYDGQGYARGHMCPSGDRTDSSADNLSTFVFTNVVPQVQSLNNGPWKGLENETRQMAAAGKTLYVTAGPIPGDKVIGNGVNVPVATWKVVVVLDTANPTAASVTTTTRIIAVIMPNDGTATRRWTEYRTSVREIERRTGLNLLSDVASSTQAIVENQVDTLPPL